MAFAGPETKIVDLKGRRVLPGLIDNHTHVVRGGLELQHGTPMGRRALAHRCHGHAQAPGGDHAAAAMGAGRRRFYRAPVCRKAAADARGDQCGGARYAGVPAASLRPGAAERRSASGRRLYQGHAGAAWRRDHPRCERQPDRACCWPSRTPPFSMRRSPRGQNCPSTIRSIPPGISCANSTGSASPASSMPAAGSRTIRTTMPSSRSSPTTTR